MGRIFMANPYVDPENPFGTNPGATGLHPVAAPQVPTVLGPTPANTALGPTPFSMNPGATGLHPVAAPQVPTVLHPVAAPQVPTDLGPMPADTFLGPTPFSAPRAGVRSVESAWPA